MKDLLLVLVLLLPAFSEIFVGIAVTTIIKVLHKMEAAGTWRGLRSGEVGNLYLCSISITH